MVGNVEQKFHEEILSGNYGLLSCLNDRPAIQRKYKSIWKIFSESKQGFSSKNATKDQLEATAKTCKKISQAMISDATCILKFKFSSIYVFNIFYVFYIITFFTLLYILKFLCFTFFYILKITCKKYIFYVFLLFYVLHF